MLYSFLFSWITFTIGVNGCTLPAEWDGVWHDSSDTTQDITFTWSSSYVVGWTVTVNSSTIISWTCVDEDTSNNLLLFKSNQTADVNSATHDVYRCIKWEKLSNYYYSYLIYADTEVNAQSKRAFLRPTTTSTDTILGCSPSNGLPSAIETVVLVKRGYIMNAVQYCPTPFLGSFTYSIRAGATTACGQTSNWDVCLNRTRMVVNYTLCAIQQFYSISGTAYCSYSTSAGSIYYVTLINTDAYVDFTFSFRFSCYAVTSSGGYVYASDSKGSCLQNQSPYNKSATGTATMTLSAYKTCPFPSDAAVESSRDNICVIAGSLTGVVLVVAAMVAGILIYKKYKAQIDPTKHSDR